VAFLIILLTRTDYLVSESAFYLLTYRLSNHRVVRYDGWLLVLITKTSPLATAWRVRWVMSRDWPTLNNWKHRAIGPDEPAAVAADRCGRRYGARHHLYVKTTAKRRREKQPTAPAGRVDLGPDSTLQPTIISKTVMSGRGTNNVCQPYWDHTEPYWATEAAKHTTVSNQL